MDYQHTFSRYELKFFLTCRQQERLIDYMASHMAPDPYGITTIRNLYLDTPNYRLIRRSLEKPTYKEKLRLRSYRQTAPGEPVFVELKKKYRGVVYKRRLTAPENTALAWLTQTPQEPPDCQIGREISYFCQYYGPLQPVIFLSYRRQAFFGLDDPHFRVTFDRDVLCRQEQLSLGQEAWGTALLPEDRVLMELKTAGGIPLWMTRWLTEERVFKTSFSKYGAAYQKQIYPEIKGGCFHAG